MHFASILPSDSARMTASESPEPCPQPTPVDINSHEGFFASVTSHLESAQSLLNNQWELSVAQLRSLEDRCLRTQAQVANLEKENLALIARLDCANVQCEAKEIKDTAIKVLDIGIQVDLFSFPDGLVASAQGGTGGSASIALHELYRMPGAVNESPRIIIEEQNSNNPCEKEEQQAPLTCQPPARITETVETRLFCRESSFSDDSPGMSMAPRRPTTAERSTFLSFVSDSYKRIVGLRLHDESPDSKKSRKTLFTDAAAMKEKVQQTIMKREYQVSNYYWDTGICQWLACHQRFQQFSLFVIFVNSVWIAYDVDENDAVVLSQAKAQFQVAEYLFCIFFTFEWIVRFAAFSDKKYCLYDLWFAFDSFMVSLMIVDVCLVNFILTVLSDSENGSADVFNPNASLTLLRLLKLARIGRAARLLNTLPELMILIKGIAMAMRSVCFTLFLLGIVIYWFSLIFRQLTQGSSTGERYFATVPDAMLSLLVRGTLPDFEDLVYDVSGEHPLLGVVLLIFILFASLTVMNMLVGVLCEVVTCVSTMEKEQLAVSSVREHLTRLLHLQGRRLCQPIAKAEFIEILGRSEAAQTLHAVGVDVMALLEVADFVFENGKLSGPEFMQLVLDMRGSNTTTVRHIVDLQKFIHHELSKTQHELEMHFGGMLCGVQRHIDAARKTDPI